MTNLLSLFFLMIKFSSCMSKLEILGPPIIHLGHHGNNMAPNLDKHCCRMTIFCISKCKSMLRDWKKEHPWPIVSFGAEVFQQNTSGLLPSRTQGTGSFINKIPQNLPPFIYRLRPRCSPDKVQLSKNRHLRNSLGFVPPCSLGKKPSFNDRFWQPKKKANYKFLPPSLPEKKPSFNHEFWPPSHPENIPSSNDGYWSSSHPVKTPSSNDGFWLASPPENTPSFNDGFWPPDVTENKPPSSQGFWPHSPPENTSPSNHGFWPPSPPENTPLINDEFWSPDLTENKPPSNRGFWPHSPPENTPPSNHRFWPPSPPDNTPSSHQEFWPPTPASPDHRYWPAGPSEEIPSLNHDFWRTNPPDNNPPPNYDFLPPCSPGITQPSNSGFLEQDHIEPPNYDLSPPCSPENIPPSNLEFLRKNSPDYSFPSLNFLDQMNEPQCPPCDKTKDPGLAGKYLDFLINMQNNGQNQGFPSASCPPCATENHFNLLDVTGETLGEQDTHVKVFGGSHSRPSSCSPCNLTFGMVG